MTKDKIIKQTSTTIFILSVTLVALKYFGLWLEGFYGMYIILIALLAGLILFGLLVIRLITFFKTRNIRIFIPLMIGTIAILAVVFEPVEYVIEKTKSPIVLIAYCEHTVTGVTLHLRQDSSFEYNTGAFLSKEIYFGNYHLKRDTLLLDFVDKQANNLKNKLILTDNGLLEIGDNATHRHLFEISFNKLTK